VLIGGDGSDILIGRLGLDVVEYDSTRGSYQITRSGPTTYAPQ
jgi:hypothetical protein